MNYIEVSFDIRPFQPFSEILIANLAEIGFESFVEKDQQLKAYISEGDFSESELIEIISSLKKEADINYSVLHIEAQNWNAEWERNFPSVEIGKYCRIRAPFHEENDSFKHEILIEPKMSFGTGHHATTFLMIECIEELELHGDNVLDMGCGTGVLAILAEKEGAKTVLAIDIEEWAYENTKENIERNNCSKIEVRRGGAELLPKDRFDLVLANINRNILLKDIAAYESSMKTDAKLVLSGFFESDVDQLKIRASELKLKFVVQKKKEDWCLLMFEK